MKVQFEEPNTGYITSSVNCGEEVYCYVVDEDGVKYVRYGTIDQAVDSPLRIWVCQGQGILVKVVEHLAAMFPELFPLDSAISIVHAQSLHLQYDGDDPKRAALIEKQYTKVTAFLGTPLRSMLNGFGYGRKMQPGMSMSDIRQLYNSLNSQFIKSLNPNFHYTAGKWNVPYLIALFRLADKHSTLPIINPRYFESRLKLLKTKGADKRLSTKDAKKKRIEMINLLKVVISLSKKAEQNKSIVKNIK